MLIEYLQKRGFSFKGEGVEQTTSCPFCEDERGKFYVNDNKGVFYCQHCKETGNIWKLRKHYGETARPLIVEEDDSVLPQDGKDIALHEALDNEAMKFLKAYRGLTEETIDHFKLGSDGKFISISLLKILLKNPF